MAVLPLAAQHTSNTLLAGEEQARRVDTSAWHGVSALANLHDKVKLAATHSCGVLLALLSVDRQAGRLRCC